MAEQNSNQSERGSPFGSDYLIDIIKSVTNSNAESQQKHQETEESSTQASASPTTDLLSAFLSNPDLISKLPTIISTVKPILDMLGAASSQKNQTKAVPAASVSTEKPPQISKAAEDRRAALLCAMKPYLSRDRQDAIDYIVKLSRLGDILKSL